VAEKPICSRLSSLQIYPTAPPASYHKVGGEFEKGPGILHQSSDSVTFIHRAEKAGCGQFSGGRWCRPVPLSRACSQSGSFELPRMSTAGQLDRSRSGLRRSGCPPGSSRCNIVALLRLAHATRGRLTSLWDRPYTGPQPLSRQIHLARWLLRPATLGASRGRPLPSSTAPVEARPLP
jgi:hypothetical protein